MELERSIERSFPLAQLARTIDEILCVALRRLVTAMEQEAGEGVAHSLQERASRRTSQPSRAMRVSR